MKRACGPKSINKTKKRNLFSEAQDHLACGFLSDSCSCWLLLCPELEADSNGLAVVILNVLGEQSGSMEKMYWSM